MGFNSGFKGLIYLSLSTNFSNKNVFKGSMMKILVNDTVIFLTNWHNKYEVQILLCQIYKIGC